MRRCSRLPLTAFFVGLAVSCGVTEGDVLLGRDAGGPGDAAIVDAAPSPDVTDGGGAESSMEADAPPDACTGIDFTSDTHNCGRCGHDCLGGACVDGACGPVLLATGPNTQAVSISSSRVYWSDQTSPDGGILSVAKDGTRPLTIATGQHGPEATWADDTNVFWTSFVDGTVWRSADDAGAPLLLATEGVGAQNIVADAVNVYWIDVYAASSIFSVPRGGLQDGGAPRVVAPSPNYAWGLAQDATNLYWTEEGGYPIMTATPGTVMTAPKDGSTAPTLVAGNQVDPKFIVADATGVYWTDEAAGNVVRVASGATQPQTLMQGVEKPFGIAIDATDVYVSTYGTNNGDGTILRGPKDGSAPLVVMVDGLSWPGALAVDDVAVYWANQSGASVMKVAK